MIFKTISTAFIFLVILMISGISSVQSQGVPDITQKLNIYNQKFPEEIVYVQTDRSTYAPGETIWLKAYVEQDMGDKKDQLSKNLFIALIDIDTLKIVNRVFLIDNNKASGSIVIPEMATSGNYKMIAYTSWMKNTPIDRVFSKDIVIEKETRNAISIDIILKDTVSLPHSQLTAYIEFGSKDESPVSATFTYRLAGSNGTIAQAEGKTDKAGKAVVNLALPAFEAQDNLTLFVDTKDKNVSASAGIVIPTPDNFLDVKFYPEGGLLLYGADSKIAFRAFNIANRPVDFKGEIVTANGKPVIKIASAFQGMGEFNLNPVKGETYLLKVTHPAGISKFFMLPAPRISGAKLSVSAKTAEILSLNFEQVNKPAQAYHLVGQVKGKVYWTETTEITDHLQIIVPLGNFPAGIAEIAAFDASWNLASKRLVAVNENKKLTIEIATDKQQYSKGERVNLTIHVKDEKGNPVETDLSLAAINKDLGFLPDDNNFLSYLNLRSNLTGYIPAPGYYFESGKIAEEVLDNLLIANYFNRFTWQTIQRTKESDGAYKIIDDKDEKLTYSDFDKSDAAYITTELRNSLMSPGKSYMVQEKNDMQKILNPKGPAVTKSGYDPGTNIMDVIYSIKPYHLMDGEFIFSGVGVNSINFAGGAGIVIDGVYTGTKPSALTSLEITEIESINVYTNPIDIQRFTALNSMGIVSVTTKRGEASNKIPAPINAITPPVMPDADIPSPDFAEMQNRTKSKSGILKTVFWNPSVRTDKSGQATVTYFNGNNPSEVLITVEGRSVTSLFGSSTKSYLVK